MYYSEIVVIKLNNKKYIALLISTIVIVVIATIAVTYAYLSFNSSQTGTNTVSTGCFDVSFTEGSNSISMNRNGNYAYPISNEKALSDLDPYIFTVTNNCATPSEYQVILNILSSTDEDILSYINYSIDGNTVNKLSNLTPTTPPSGASSNTTSSYIIDTGSLAGINASQTYELRMWIDESAGNGIMGSSLEAEVMVYSVAG